LPIDFPLLHIQGYFLQDYKNRQLTTRNPTSSLYILQSYSITSSFHSCCKSSLILYNWLIKQQ